MAVKTDRDRDAFLTPKQHWTLNDYEASGKQTLPYLYRLGRQF